MPIADNNMLYISMFWGLDGGDSVLVLLFSWVAKSCPLFCSPMDCSLSDSSVHGIFQVKILEWVAISFFMGNFLTQGLNLHLLHFRQILFHWVTWEALPDFILIPKFLKFYTLNTAFYMSYHYFSAVFHMSIIPQ